MPLDQRHRNVRILLRLSNRHFAFQVSYELTGNGDVLDPQHDCMGVGSGGAYALSAAWRSWTSKAFLLRRQVQLTVNVMARVPAVRI